MKEIIGFITIGIAIIGLLPYVWDTLKGKTKPHLFSWIIWTISTALVFIGQVQKGGGPGAWSTGTVALLGFFITLLTLKKGTRYIIRLDKVLFVISLVSIIPWVLTKDPTISVLILTGINISATVLTIKKTIKYPGSETLFLYAANIVRHILSMFALSNYTLATYIFPVSVFFVNILMVIIILNPNAFLKSKKY